MLLDTKGEQNLKNHRWFHHGSQNQPPEHVLLAQLLPKHQVCECRELDHDRSL